MSSMQSPICQKSLTLEVACNQCFDCLWEAEHQTTTPAQPAHQPSLYLEGVVHTWSDRPSRCSASKMTFAPCLRIFWACALSMVSRLMKTGKHWPVSYLIPNLRLMRQMLMSRWKRLHIFRISAMCLSRLLSGPWMSKCKLLLASYGSSKIYTVWCCLHLQEDHCIGGS